MIYIITEKQDAASTRKGQSVEAPDLSSAKRKATKMQMFQRTTLTIEAENGALLAIKKDGKWEDQ